jgi:uncharacterized protein (DUF1800 family)
MQDLIARTPSSQGEGAEAEPEAAAATASETAAAVPVVVTATVATTATTAGEGGPGAALGAGAALIAAALLAACSDGSDPEPMPEGFRDPASAQSRPALMPRQQSLAVSGYRTPTPTEVLDFAERQYREFFPSREADREVDGIVYRYYPASGNHVGVSGGMVLILGPMSGGQLVTVGSVQSFAAAIFAGTPVQVPRSDEDAARLLLQAQFSASLADIAQVRAMGYEAWLDAELARPNSLTGCDWLQSKGYAAIDSNEFFFALGTNVHMIWYQLFQSPDAVRRRWALALSEIFVVSWRGIRDVMNWDNFAMAEYWDLLCRHALGNFRDLLEALTLNPAMGAFLSTRGNQREDPATGRLPDENYAREVMQLFTIGLHRLNMDGTLQRDAQGQPIESYTADDVSNLARVFTGYDQDLSAGHFISPAPPFHRVSHVPSARNPMVFNASRHSSLPKAFLGVTIPAGTPGPESLRIALDTLVNHPNTAPFLARQFIQRLVTGNPSPAYVSRVAHAFANNGSGVRGDLKAVLKAVLLDDEARGTASLSRPGFGKLREPMLRVAQWGRTFKLRSLRGSWKAGFGPWDPTTDLGQYPLDPPSVFGFYRPGYVPPGTEMAKAGATAPEFQIVNETTVATWANLIMSMVFNGLWVRAPDKPYSREETPTDGFDIVPDYAEELALVADTPALVRRLNLLLCAGQLSQSTTDLIIEGLQADNIRADANLEFKRIHVARAIVFVMCSPDYLVQR